MTSPAKIAQAAYQLPTSAFGTPALINPGPTPGAPAMASDGLEMPRRGSPELMAALEELDNALPDYLTAKGYYEGDPDELFASDEVQRLLNKAGVNGIQEFNYAAIPVDAVVEKMRIRAVTVVRKESEEESQKEEIPPQRVLSATGKAKPDAAASKREAATKKAQKVLDRLRRANKMQVQEGNLAKEMCEYGDSYLMVWPVTEESDGELGPEEDEEPSGIIDLERPDGKVVSCDIYVNSPLTTRMFYDDENPLLKSHVIKRWDWFDPDVTGDDDPKRTRATLTYSGRIERWVTKLNTSDPSDPDNWEPYLVEGKEWPAKNPTGRIPYFHCRTEWVYGKPEHFAAYGPQQVINKLMSAHAVTIDYQSFPQRYALLNPKADDILGNLINPDNPEDDDDDPEGDGHSQLRADPSAVWKLPGVTSVGQFAPADPQVFLAPFDRYVRAIAETTGTPLHRFTGYTEPPSGASLQVSDEVLNDKVQNRHRDLGGELSDAYEFALELMGFTDYEVIIKWEPARAAVGVDDWNIVEKKIANGVPVKNALMEAGYPEDEVQEWLVDETGADLTRRVALLNSLGTAIQAISAGVATGLVSSKQAGDIISRFLALSAEQLPVLEEAVELQDPNAVAMEQRQQTQRGQQMSEHQAANAAGPPDRFGQPTKLPPLPDAPPPPEPVRVGN